MRKLAPNFVVGVVLDAAACWPKRLILAAPGDAEDPKLPDSEAPKPMPAGAAAGTDADADAPNRPAWQQGHLRRCSDCCWEQREFPGKKTMSFLSIN